MINRQAFNEAFQHFDQEVVVEIIDIFLEEGPQKLKELEQNVAELDFKKINFNAHSIKSVVASLSDEETKELANQLEQKGKACDADQIVPLMENFKLSLNQLISQLTEIRRELAG